MKEDSKAYSSDHTVSTATITDIAATPTSELVESQTRPRIVKRNSRSASHFELDRPIIDFKELEYLLCVIIPRATGDIQFIAKFSGLAHYCQHAAYANSEAVEVIERLNSLIANPVAHQFTISELAEIHSFIGLLLEFVGNPAEAIQCHINALWLVLRPIKGLSVENEHQTCMIMLRLAMAYGRTGNISQRDYLLDKAAAIKGERRTLFRQFSSARRLGSG